ncbi:MAG TPA: hypothetical protein VJN67_03545 [Stellaceae bacterium]|nr:hypothetical protein [Stellaceae bacterium]
MNIRVFLAAASVLPCVGCVSVFEGTSQDIHVATSPAGATCVFERQGQNIGSIVNTPGVLTVRKNKYDITIRCDKPGYEQASYNNHSGVSAAIAANIAVDILLTAGIASIVDSANGADNKYDSVVNLTLIPVVPQAAGAAPAPPSAAAPPSTSSATPAPPVSLASATRPAMDPRFRCPRAGTVVQYNNGTTMKFAGENGFRCNYVDQNLKDAAKFGGFADDAKFVDAGLTLLWPLSVGKQQTVSVSVSGAYLTHNFSVLRTERVDTPAGSFDTFVVEEEETGTGAQWAKRSYWYAPEPGLIVKSTFTLLKTSDTASHVGTAGAILVPGDYVATRIEGVGATATP